MESTRSESAKRGSNRLSLIVAGAALLVAIATFMQLWVFRNNMRLQASPGSAYIVFLDENGKFASSLADDYGQLMLRRVDAKRARRVEMTVGDAGLIVKLYRDEKPVAQWTLSDDGEKFERLAK
jgi:hypothetical protein